MATSRYSPVLIVVLLLVAVPVLNACSSSSSSSTDDATQLAGVLSGEQEVVDPAVVTDAKGNTTVTVNSDRSQIDYSIEMEGAFNGVITQAHFHHGDIGENGPVFLFVCTNLDNAPDTVPVPQPCPQTGETITGSLTADDFIATAGLATFADAVDALLDGETYINVHSDAHPAGEIRGQVGAASFNLVLNGDQEVPPVTTDATGNGEVDLNRLQSEISYFFEVTGPFNGDITQAHIHVGAMGENGPVLFFLCTDLDNAPDSVPEPPLCSDTLEGPDGSLSGTLTIDHFIPRDDEGISTFADAVNALITGNTYVNVHSTAHGPGEIRGQILSKGAIQLAGVLSGEQEVVDPPVVTDAKGNATVTVNSDRTQIDYTIEMEGTFNDVITQAHFHHGGIGENGPVFLFVCTNLDNAPDTVPVPQPCPQTADTVTGSLTAEDFIETPGLATFADAVDALLDGETYINVHSVAHPPGEIRGQIGEASFSLQLDGDQEVPSVATDATGEGEVDLDRLQSEISYVFEVTGPFNGDITQAHIHVGAMGENGPVLFFLCTDLDNAPDSVPEPPLCSDTLEGSDGSLSGTLTVDHFIPRDDEGISTFADAVNALITGNTYVNVHSTAHAPGEIRGQILAD